MRTLLLISGFVLAIIAFSSCEKKEGVYTPNMKIKTIHEQWSDPYSETDGLSPKILLETWQWDGKLIDKINYTIGEEFISTASFEYDKKRISKIVNDYGEYGMVDELRFIYDGSKLSQVQAWSENYMYTKMTITHDKSHITEILVEYFFDQMQAIKNLPKDIFLKQALKTVFPSQTVNLIVNDKKLIENIEAKSDTYNYTIKLSYNGANIKEEKIIHTDGYEETYTYFYDSERNPYRGLLFTNGEETGEGISKNNIVKIIEENNQGHRSEREFSITYQNHYPVEITYESPSYKYTIFFTYY
ncbi:MAG: hypothetical protein GX879_03015 [Bacteroidales bacterium]|nr:hypothetical protein [Bacteroidales bacterium]